MQYLEYVTAERAAYVAMTPSRAAYDDAAERTELTVEEILDVEAEGLFGIGVKLAAMRDDSSACRDPAPDHEDAIISALREIDRLIGSTFVSSFKVHMWREEAVL